MFVDRADAGRALADEVELLGGLKEPVVVALPRGGVPVGFEVARRLKAPLVVMPVAKVGVPGREELALGAVAPGGVEVLNDDVVAALALDDAELAELVGRAMGKVALQLEAYKAPPEAASLAGRSAVVVDDGLATGASMRAALLAVRRMGPFQVVLAVPVAPPEVLQQLASLADEEVCVLCPRHMQAVGAWYADFSQTSDAEVARLLAAANAQPNGED